MSENKETTSLQKEDTPVESKNESTKTHDHNEQSEEKMYSSSGEPLMSAEEYKQYQQMTDGWSWSGAALPWVTFIVGRRWGLLIFCVITNIIPWVNIIAMIGWFIYGGLKGKQIIYNSPKLLTTEEKQGAIKALEMGGLGTFLLYIAGFAIVMIIVIFSMLILVGIGPTEIS